MSQVEAPNLSWQSSLQRQPRVADAPPLRRCGESRCRWQPRAAAAQGGRAHPSQSPVRISLLRQAAPAAPDVQYPANWVQGGAMAEKPGFLPNLTTSFIELHKKENLGTLEFATACGQVLPIFDHIGERRTQRELAPACTHACRRRPLAESSLSAASSLHPVCRALFTAPTFTAPCRHRLPHRQVRVLGQGVACIGTGRQRRRCRNTAECTQSLASAGRGLSRGVCLCRPAGRVEV